LKFKKRIKLLRNSDGIRIFRTVYFAKRNF
jgi:hypothetical protein